MALLTEPFLPALVGAARVRGHEAPPVAVFPADVEDLDRAKVASLAVDAADTVRRGWCDDR